MGGTRAELGFHVPLARGSSDYPFHFLYDNVSSDLLLPHWQGSASAVNDTDGLRRRLHLSWLGAEGEFSVHANMTLFPASQV